MLELTDFERETIAGALRERAAALGDYAQWVDDRPNLPARQEAIDKTKAEAKSALKLAYYVQFGERL